MNNRRWYDKFDETTRAFDLLQALNRDLQKKFSKDIMNVAAAIKNVNKENETAPLSLGVNRVLGLYQSGQKRRWYDKTPDLSSAVKTISTLPDTDYLHVMEGIVMSAKD